VTVPNLSELVDPFDKKQDYSVVNLKGLFSAKIDWLLLQKNLQVVRKEMARDEIIKGNTALSDHKYLLVEIKRK